MFILTSAGSCLASVAAVCACQACQGVTREVLRKSARLAYCALFTTAMVLAWVLRDFAKPLIEKIPCKSWACNPLVKPNCFFEAVPQILLPDRDSTSSNG